MDAAAVLLRPWREHLLGERVFFSLSGKTSGHDGECSTLASGMPFALSPEEASVEDSKPNTGRRVEGAEGGGAHQEGPNSVQAGQTQRRGKSAPEKARQTGRSTRQGNKRSTDGPPTGHKV